MGASANGGAKLSIVVPTYNRREVLAQRTLPAIFQQDVNAADCEIVVVVDGSTDGTAEALAKLEAPCTLRVVEQANAGPSAARNRGIQEARGELILFLDDEIICGPRLLQQHLEAHADAEPMVAFGPIAMAEGTPPSVVKYAIVEWYERYYRHIEAQGGLKWPVDDYLISNSSIPRATLVACGGFDESLPAKEDYELGLRLWKAGVRFKYLPQAKAYEFYVKPSRYVLSNDGRGFGKAEVLLCRKHPEYRRYSPLAALGKTFGWKRGRRRLLTELTFPAEEALAGPLALCDRFCRYPRVRKLGHRLLGMGRGVVEFRAAAQEAGSWDALQQEFGRRLPVLLYHHVGPPRPGMVPGLGVLPERFERHVAWLAQRGYQGIGAREWLRWLREGKGLPEKPILVTFDDGYEDLAEYALPVLKRYGFGAVVYIVTGQLGGTNVWDVANGFGAMRLMTAGQIRHWAGQGIEFGAHSRSHPNLSKLGAHELEREVAGSGEDLERLLGSRVVSFAYPFGYHSRAVDDCVRGAFDLAFIADDDNEGLNHLENDPYQLLRTTMQADDSLFALEFRAAWGRYPFLNLRGKLALRTRLKRLARRVFGPNPVETTR